MGFSKQPRTFRSSGSKWTPYCLYWLTYASSQALASRKTVSPSLFSANRASITKCAPSLTVFIWMATTAKRVRRSVMYGRGWLETGAYSHSIIIVRYDYLG